MRPGEIVHNAFEVSQRAAPIVEGLFWTPPRMAGAVFLVAKQVVTDSVKVVRPRTSQELARDLAGAHVKEEADEALEKIRIGRQTHIPEIVSEGRTDLAKVVIKAGEAETVPWKDTDQVIEMAKGAKVDPGCVKGNERERLESVLERHDVVEDMSIYKENKL